jgi:hypothetical protein
MTWDDRKAMTSALASSGAPSQWPKTISAWQHRAEKLLAGALDPKPRDLKADFRELSLVETGAQAAWGWTEETYRDLMLAGGVNAENAALVSARRALGDAGILKVTSNAALRALMDRAERELCGTK